MEESNARLVMVGSAIQSPEKLVSSWALHKPAPEPTKPVVMALPVTENI